MNGSCWRRARDRRRQQRPRRLTVVHPGGALRGVGGVGSAMFTVSAVSLRCASPTLTSGTGHWHVAVRFPARRNAGPAIGGPLTSRCVRRSSSTPSPWPPGRSAAFLTHTPLHDKEVAGPQVERPSWAAHCAFRHRAALMTNLGNGWALFGVRRSLIPLFVTEPGCVGNLTGVGSSCRRRPRASCCACRPPRRHGRLPARDDPRQHRNREHGPARHVRSRLFIVSMAIFTAAPRFSPSRRAPRSATSSPAAAAPSSPPSR